MPPRKKVNSRWTLPATHLVAAKDALGYLNFSSGNSDPQFLRNINSLWEVFPEDESRRVRLLTTLLKTLDDLSAHTLRSRILSRPGL